MLAYVPASYTPERKAFVRRLPGGHDKVPYPLRAELGSLGIAGFYTPRGSDIDLMEALASMIPVGFDDPALGGSGRGR